MPSRTDEVAYDIAPYIRVYEDGRVERLMITEIVPPSTNPESGVQSKDAIIDPETGLSARLYIPRTTTTSPDQKKLPLLVYFHGGGFCMGNAFSQPFHNHLDSFAAEANVVVVSVNYRKAPEHPLPVAYDDSWAAIKWVASHSTTGGGGGHDEPEVWLKDYVDFNHLFFAGDSAGANIAHNMAIRVGSEGLDGAKLVGIALVQPYFTGKKPIGAEHDKVKEKEFYDKFWLLAYPLSCGLDDPLINPFTDPKFLNLGCTKVLVCVAEKDSLRERGWYYCEELGKSGWGGVVEVMEAEGEEHWFHVFNPTCENAVAMFKRLAAFMN